MRVYKFRIDRVKLKPEESISLLEVRWREGAWALGCTWAAATVSRFVFVTLCSFGCHGRGVRVKRFLTPVNRHLFLRMPIVNDCNIYVYKNRDGARWETRRERGELLLSQHKDANTRYWGNNTIQVQRRYCVAGTAPIGVKCSFIIGQSCAEYALTLNSQQRRVAQRRRRALKQIE